VFNGLGLYATSIALARALEPIEFPKRERVVEFNLVPGASVVPSDDIRPVVGNESEAVSSRHAPTRGSVSPSKAKPGPARDQSKTADGRSSGEQLGLGQDEESGVGDESLVDAPDGKLEDVGTATAGRPDPLALLGGSPSVLDQTFGRPVVDRMRDVDEDATSVLDSKRHLFGSFFNRLRDRVAEEWKPEKVHRLADPHGTRFGDKQRMTVLMVRLNAQGEVVKIEVERKSGAPHLDEEAERALRAAAPFPNMPEGLVDEHGNVDFRFGFILDFNGGSRIFRYQ
jgi:TonB family protein